MFSILARQTFVRAGLAAAAALAVICPSALAETWPSKPIKIIVGFPPGGLSDLLGRAYGEYLSQKLGQSVVVENKPGAAGIIAAQAVKASPADGHTLMLMLPALLAHNRVTYKTLPYDPDNDFVLISSIHQGQLPFVVSKATGASNLKEFVEYARKNRTSVGTWSAGSWAHIVIVELNKQFGLQIEAVHYKGEAPMWQDLSAGTIQAALGSYVNASKVLQSGAGRAIAMLPKRSKRLPDVPAFPEQGVTSKAFQLKGYIGLAGPAGIPQEVVERLSALMVEASRSERLQKLRETFALDEPAVGHAEATRLHEEEKPIWIELVRGLGLAPQ
jgi:tripartite-type tricarboxylate transporter receptor subunit TctC